MAIVTEIDPRYNKPLRGFKPTLFTVPVLLLIAVFVLAGYSKEYRAERLYWYAERAALTVSKDPAGATQRQAADAVRAFQQVVDKTPGAFAAAKAQFAIGSIYAARKQYPQAREAYERVIRNYGGAFESFAYAARVALVRIYRAESNRAAVAGLYKEIMQYHPWTPIGLDAPMLLARDLEEQGAANMSREVAGAWQFAAEYYTSLADKSPVEASVLAIKGRLAMVYERLEQWENLEKTLQDLAASRERIVNHPKVLLALASVYESKLNEPAKAAELYGELAKNYSGSPSGKAAASHLAFLAQKDKASSAGH